MLARWRAPGVWIVVACLFASIAVAKEKKESQRGAWPRMKENSRPAPASLQPSSVRPFAPHLPAFVLSEIYYFDPGTGTRYQARRQGSTWILPVVDTLQERMVNFLFSSNVPREEIADVVQKKACCYQLLVSNQSLPVKTISFYGDRVFLWASVAGMQAWPKTVQLRMYHSGSLATPADASRAPMRGVGIRFPAGAATAPSAVQGMPSASAVGSPFATAHTRPPSRSSTRPEA